MHANCISDHTLPIVFVTLWWLTSLYSKQELSLWSCFHVFSPLNLSLTNTRRVLINDTRTNKLLGILRFFWTWTWSWLLVRPKKKLSNPRLKGQALKKPAPLQHWMRCKCKSIRLRLIASLEQLVSSWHRMALGKAHFVLLEQAIDHQLLYYYLLWV